MKQNRNENNDKVMLTNVIEMTEDMSKIMNDDVNDVNDENEEKKKEEEEIVESEDTPFKSYSMMSKKRFYEIVDVMTTYIKDEEKAREAIETLKEIMRFDPSAKQYTKDSGKARRERYRERALLEGKSFYEISGIKQSYHKRKARKKEGEREREREGNKNSSNYAE